MQKHLFGTASRSLHSC